MSIMLQEIHPTSEWRSITSSGRLQTVTAMDALKQLVANIPEWLKRLDEQTDQITQRQINPAKVAQSPSRGSSSGGGRVEFAARSIRNRSSIESLKPKDEPEAHARDPNDAPLPAPRKSSPPAVNPARTPPTNTVDSAADPSSSPIYYNGSVQESFKELVESMSAVWNMIRKAKSAARFARLLHRAEMEMVDDDAEDELPGLGADAGNSLAALPTPNGVVLGGGTSPLGGTALEVATEDDGEPQTPKIYDHARHTGQQDAAEPIRTGDGTADHPSSK